MQLPIQSLSSVFAEFIKQKQNQPVQVLVVFFFIATTSESTWRVRCVLPVTVPYHLQVIDACVHPRQHLSPLLGGFRTRVQGRPEPGGGGGDRISIFRSRTFQGLVQRLGNPLPLADLLDSVLQLVSLEEDDEDGLVDLVSLRGHRTIKTESDTSCAPDDAVKKKSSVRTVVGSSRGSSMSACLRNTFPLQTLHSILSNVGILSLPMTPATNLKQIENFRCWLFGLVSIKHL